MSVTQFIRAHSFDVSYLSPIPVSNFNVTSVKKPFVGNTIPSEVGYLLWKKYNIFTLPPSPFHVLPFVGKTTPSEVGLCGPFEAQNLSNNYFTIYNSNPFLGPWRDFLFSKLVILSIALLSINAYKVA